MHGETTGDKGQAVPGAVQHLLCVRQHETGGLLMVALVTNMISSIISSRPTNNAASASFHK